MNQVNVFIAMSTWASQTSDLPGGQLLNISCAIIVIAYSCE